MKIVFILIMSIIAIRFEYKYCYLLRSLNHILKRRANCIYTENHPFTKETKNDLKHISPITNFIKDIRRDFKTYNKYNLLD